MKRWGILFLGVALQVSAQGGEMTLKARPFELQDVRLLDGPFKAAMERDETYLLAIDPDRLLHN